MKHARQILRAVAFCVVLVAASCASPNPKLYTLAPLPGVALSGAPRVVELRGIGIPRYLQRSQIVRSSENYRLDLRDNDWWGEPLDAMLSRILAEDLGQRLPHTTIYSSTGAVSAAPDATVELDVQRVDLDGGGNLVFIAQGSVSFKNQPSSDTRGFHISQPAPSQTAEGQVAATSSALAQIADRIAAMLASRPPRR